MGIVCYTAKKGFAMIPQKSSYSLRGLMLCTAFSDDADDIYNTLCKVSAGENATAQQTNVYSPLTGWVTGYNYYGVLQ